MAHVHGSPCNVLYHDAVAPSKRWREEWRAGESMVTFVGVGGGRSLENVARHDGGGAVHHALALIVCYGDGVPSEVA